MDMQNSIKDTALIFEGGGMRASYTAGFVNILLENKLYFDYVAGISAGASHSVNYLSKDTWRTKYSFVDLVRDSNFGGWRSFLKGEGYFRAKYIYEEISKAGAVMPFDFKTFKANPARLRIGAFEQDSGQLKYYAKEDISTLRDLMKIVRSSSSLPLFMPPTYYNGKYYVDGGLGGGIALDIAKKDNMKRFFVVLSREKGYKKRPPRFCAAIRAFYKKSPYVAEALLNRHIIYNQTLEELRELENDGRAFLVYPDVMSVSSREKNYHKLLKSYETGYAQGQADLHKWKNFLL